MVSDPNAAHCDLCGREGGGLDPLVPDEYYEGVYLHLHCLNSPAGGEWISARAEADRGYARYLALITLGYEIVCPTCATTQSVSPKASGMGAGHWELSCTACHRYRPLLNAYRGPAESGLYAALCRLSRDFKLNRDSAGIALQVETIAGETELQIPGEPCNCGGRFSLSASPRCSNCAGVLLESPFHITTTRSLAET